MEHQDSRVLVLQNQVKVMRNEIKNIRDQVTKGRRDIYKEIQAMKEKGVEEYGCSASPGTRMNHQNSLLPGINPIGIVNSWYKSKNGTPRQPGICSMSKGVITLQFNRRSGINAEHLLQGLQGFSHIWVLFVFHQNEGSFHKAKVAPPRHDGQRVGVFSTRSPHRPNPIGLSLTKLEKIEQNHVYISGHDMLDGTPVLDIKPYIPDYDVPSEEANGKNDSLERTERNNSDVKIPKWIHKDRNKLKVVFTQRAENDLTLFRTNHEEAEFRLRDLQGSGDLREAIIQILSADPRSVYRREKCKDSLYYVNVDNVHCTAWFDDQDEIVEVLKLKPIPKEFCRE